MKRAFLFLVFFAALARGADVPLLTVADSINPGTADYVISGIKHAEASGAPYVILQLDTPGGLVSTTRLIVQQMLNTKVPVVVYVGPRGAHAGSAGALITFAADVAAMAPGTNIGAAHPVAVGNEKIDKTMAEKLANDVAAFAESLAKTKGRNTDWAIRAVRNSESIIAEEALKRGVIDLMADDVEALAKQLAGFALKAPKFNLKALPTDAATPKAYEPSVKQRVISFFADPNIAYLIMTLGGLCIWVELTHPGLIFPGVLGALCILISLISFQALPIHYGALALVLLGMALLVVEMFVPSFGVLGIGGLIAFLIGSLYLMDTNVPEFQISLGLILPTAAGLAAVALFLGWVVMRAQKRKNLSGSEALVGEFGQAREPVNQSQGKIFISGELWNAVSRGEEIPAGSLVKVLEVKNLQLVVAPVGPAK